MAFSHLTPHICRVSLLCFHLLDVLLSFVFAHIALGLDDVQQDVSHVGGHVFGVTVNDLLFKKPNGKLKIDGNLPAKVKMSLVLNDVPNQVGVSFQQVSDVKFLRLIAGEGESKIETSL